MITVPSGFVPDGASIPRILHIAIPTTGWYGRAAIIHDYLYWSQLCTREQADNLMLIAMKESTVIAAHHRHDARAGNAIECRATLPLGDASALNKAPPDCRINH